MKIDGLSHPKTKELSYELGVPLPHAIGLLELMWAFVGRQTPRGNIGKWSNAVIAGECGWLDCPDKFVSALVSVGFVDEHADHRLIVHDWHDHAPRWVFAKLKSSSQQIIRADLSSDLRHDLSVSSAQTKGGATRVSKPREAKGSQGKGSEKPAPDDAPSPTRKNDAQRPDDIDEQTWSDFLAHRRQKKAKLTPTAWKPIRKQLDLGIKAGHDPNEMLAVAMAAGWQGFQFEWYENRTKGSPAKPAIADDHRTKTYEGTPDDQLPASLR